jgi:hypothetical protein
MTASQLPSPSEFVVSMTDGGLDEALAAPDDPVPTSFLDDGSFIIELPDESDPRAAWKRLVDRYGAAAWVSPVVFDEGSIPHYPTGDVTVRFRGEVPDEEMQRFAESNGLELLARNEFVPEQASFHPRDPRGTYLPELVEQLEREDAVETAWLNTKSIYKRA